MMVVPDADGDRGTNHDKRDHQRMDRGELPGPNETLIEVKHFPQGPYERRRRNDPLLCST